MVFIGSVTLKINAISKIELPYEILDIKYNKEANNLTITGWAYLNDKQHYNNPQDHSTAIIIKSKSHTKKYLAKAKNISFTELEKFANNRYCKNNEYFKDAKVCNYRYNDVGFVAVIPLNDLKMNEEYIAQIEFIAKDARSSGVIDIYFPIKKNLSFASKQAKTRIESSINDVQLKINYNLIYARSGPSKSSPIHKDKTPCSKAYDGFNFFRMNSTYKRVLDRQTSNNITYYKLSGAPDRCSSEGRNLIKEGTSIKPIWIASNFVSYLGKPLTIRTEQNNTIPIIKTHDITVYDNEKINLLDNVVATDKEDGDLTKRIKIISNDYKPVAGSYSVTYQVTDNFGATVQKKRVITVLKRNVNPIINASDKTIKQYGYFDPYDDVSAYDQDKNNLTNKIKLTSTVDTTILKTQKQCYFVKDKYNLSTSKCINVYILKVDTIKNLRFIQKSHLFYKELIPVNWKNKLNIIQEAIENSLPYSELYIKR